MVLHAGVSEERGARRRSAPGARRIAYILRSFPRLSQTFVLNEVLALEGLGHEVALFAMTRSNETVVQEGVSRVAAQPSFLDEDLRRPLVASVREHAALALRHPLRYLGTALFLVRRSDLVAGYTTITRRAAFAYAVHLAAVMRNDHEVDHVHAHFAHDPALLALLLHKLTRIPYSFTAHARDMVQIPPSALRERVHHAGAVVTICRANVDYLARVARDGSTAKLELVRTGIDLDAWRPRARRAVDGAPPLIAVVSRLVAKKGLLDLVEALARVKAGGRAFRCVIYGDGPQGGKLERALARLGLDDDVELAGARTQAELPDLLARADLFALTPFVTGDGDRDGLPCAILEAMACGLPVVATAVAGIPEAVVHGETGLLAEPRDVDAIARHIASLLDDAALRARLGGRAREAIAREWSARDAVRRLAAVFESASSGGHR